MAPVPQLSIVLPVFNEEDTLPELHQRLLAVVEALGVTCELIFVDDGSADRSLEMLLKMAAADTRIGVLSFSRNFGHQAALTAGLDHARGDAVVLMDSDLQDPPELIPEMMARFREGYDVVYAQRRSRPGESIVKRGTAHLFYRLVRAIAAVDIPPDTGDFRLLSRRSASVLRALPERRRFLRGLVSWTGYRQTRVLYDRPPRKVGESKYSLRQMIRLALMGTFQFSSVPVFVIGVVGALVCAGALVAAVAGVPALSAAYFFLGGIQLIALWVVGNYVVAAADEVRGRPLYLLSEAVNVQPRSIGEADAAR